MFKEFDYETLAFEERGAIHDALAQTTLKHIEGSDGLFEAIPFDPARNPSQMLEATHLEPMPTNRSEVAALSDIASQFMSPFIRESLADQPTTVSAIRRFLQEGTHIFPVTNHQKIHDVAIWGANVSDMLEEEHWQEQNGHIISRGVTTIGAFGMAASEVLQKDGHVFMSFPRTPTIEQLGFDDLLIRTNNKHMRNEVHAWLGEDFRHRIFRNRIGKVLNIALSGKTDLVTYGDNHRPERVVLGKVADGTLDIIKRGLVLPIVLWEGEHPVFKMGEFTTVTNQTDVLRVQQWQRETLAKALGIAMDAVVIER